MSGNRLTFMPYKTVKKYNLSLMSLPMARINKGVTFASGLRFNDMVVFPSSSERSRQLVLTYRQKRRLIQAERNGPKRGPTTGKKYLREKQRDLEAKPKIDFSEELRRVVGKDADRFICECSQWVKEYCPLDSENWSRMNPIAKQRLFAKIKGSFTLPETLCGEPIDVALRFQCSSFYRGWRYRLKEEHFDPNSREQSRANKPPDVEREKWNWLVDFWMTEKQQRISGNNRALRLSQNIKPANGAKSTARILDEMLNAPPQPRAESENTTVIGDEEEPIYIRLYERTKKHKDGSWDPDAEMNYNALKRRHSDEVEKNGIDDLTVQEAYTDVLKTRPGYIRGLGPGSQLPKKNRSGETNQLREKVQEIQQAAAEREAELNGVITELRMSNCELHVNMSQMHQEALEREKKMKEEALEREKRLQEEALEREKKLQEVAQERDKRMREEFIQLMRIYRNG